MSTVLIPTDGSPAAEEAIGHGVSIADRLDGTVHGLFVVHLTANADYNLGIDAPTIREKEENRGVSALDAIERHCEATGVNFEGHLREGRPAETITSVGKEIDADVITMGTQGASGLYRPLLGSTTLDVLLEGTHPVLAIPEGSTVPTEGYERFLVATDASEQSREAEEKALVWADAFEASIHGLYVVEQGLSDSDEVKEELETEGKQAVGELEARAKDAGVEASTAVDIGVPHEVICSQAEENDTDLIALGAHGRSGIERTYFGSVAQRTVRTATRPVLVV